jgi:hypothetical protein
VQAAAHRGEDLIELVTRRCERASILLTSNRPVDDLGKLLGDTAAMPAIFDRLLHHAHVRKRGDHEPGAPGSTPTCAKRPPCEAWAVEAAGAVDAQTDARPQAPWHAGQEPAPTATEARASRVSPTKMGGLYSQPPVSDPAPWSPVLTRP